MPGDISVHVKTILLETTKKALQMTKGNRTEAAKLMGVSVRTLRNWINKFKIAKDFPPPNLNGADQK